MPAISMVAGTKNQAELLTSMPTIVLLRSNADALLGSIKENLDFGAL